MVHYEDIRNHLERNRLDTFIPTHLATVQQDLALEDTLTASREELSQANINMTRAVTEKFDAAANSLTDSVKEMVDALETIHSVKKVYAMIP